ncbi:MAG: Nif11-like leader peptide family natural product precursor, partial [Elusimicrobiales bacterium]|nr:Nif11-like leader peptide family natural product precursor [Elusimicrobiales bacterium]
MRVQFHIILMEVLKMPNDKNVITKEQFEKAMQCKTAEELIALAKAEGVEFTKE